MVAERGSRQVASFLNERARALFSLSNFKFFYSLRHINF
jgi:hypothetical protein